MKTQRLLIAVAGAFLSAASFWMSLPLIAVSLRAAGVSDVKVGLISALPWVGLLVVSPMIPYVINGLGLQRTVLTGIFTSIAVFIGFACTRSVLFWSLLFFIQGGTLALRWAAMDTWINGAVPDHARGRLVGAYELIASGSMAAGPAILVLVGTAGGEPFLAGAAAASCAAILLIIAGREAPMPVSATARLSARQIWSIERAAYIGIFLIGLTEAANLSLLPVFSLSLGTPPHLAALLAVFVQTGVAVGAVLFGTLADRFSRRVVFLVCGIVVCGAPLLVPLLAGTTALWPVLLAWGLAQGGAFTLAMVMLGARFQGPSLAPAIALAMAVYTVGGIAGPPAMGSLMSLAGPDALPYGLGVAAFLALGAASCFEVFRPHVVIRKRDITGRPA